MDKNVIFCYFNQMAVNKKQEENLKRPPIVVVVGHVDHGKTSLLDYIRKTNVTAKEAGGITQSIGAYEIEHRTPNSEQAHKITFIDTPGHEAFSKMRIRGAHIADIGILVVAGDEGVKPQTKEAVKALTDSKTPFIVAITKIDKPNTDLERVKNDLTANGVLLEGYGGSTSYQGVSSKNGEGINELLDLILLTAEMEDLKYNPLNKGKGVILESKLDNRRGLTVHLVLEDGSLRLGDLIATPTAKGKIKIQENFLGERINELYPSSPATVLGFEVLPQIGEEFMAGELSAEELDKTKPKEADIGRFGNSSDKKELVIKLILKADVGGSLEALSELIKKIPLGENQNLIIIEESIGEITDGDVKNAIATSSIIIGFRVKANKAAENLAKDNNITLIVSEIIYELIETVKKYFKESQGEKAVGELEILAVFGKKAGKQIIGGTVVNGLIRNNSWVEIKRGNDIIGKGKIINLQQNKKDVSSVSEGNECGILANSEIQIAVGDYLILR